MLVSAQTRAPCKLGLVALFIDSVCFICIHFAASNNVGIKSNRLTTPYDKENLVEPLRRVSDQIEEEGRSLGIIKNLKYGVGIVNPTYKLHRSTVVKDANGNMKRIIWKCPIKTKLEYGEYVVLAKHLEKVLGEIFVFSL